MVSEHTTVYLGGFDAPLRLTERLGYALSHQEEGLVLKPRQDPYLSLNDHQLWQVKLNRFV